jgi:hypothetical protein
MSLTSYRAAPPRDGCFSMDLGFGYPGSLGALWCPVNVWASGFRRQPGLLHPATGVLVWIWDLVIPGPVLRFEPGLFAGFRLVAYILGCVSPGAGCWNDKSTRRGAFN